MKPVETKIGNNTANDYKPKKISRTFDGKYIECKSEGDGQLSINEYLENRPYLSNIIDNLRISGEWKI